MCNTSSGAVWIGVEREGKVRGAGRDLLQSGGLLQSPGLISRLIDEVSGRTGTERDPATGGSFGIFEGTTKGEDVV